MTEFNDERSPGHESYVKRKTALDLMASEAMIDELVERKRLLVITAERMVDRAHHNKPGLLEGARRKLAEDIGYYLLSQKCISFEENYNYKTRQVHYSGNCIFLMPLPEECDA